MTDQHDEAVVDSRGSTGEMPAPVVPASISRRALVRGASVALPTILTLNSNAAFGWAVTSGTIGTRPAKPDATGDVVCVRGGTPVAGKEGTYNVGDSDFFNVPGDYYYSASPGNSGTRMNAEQACEYAETIHYSATGSGPATQSTDPIGGAVASLTGNGAMESFAAIVHPSDWF